MSARITVRVRLDARFDWGTVKDPEMTIDRALRLAASYSLEGQEAEIWVDGRRMWPRLDAASEGLPQASRKAEAGRAVLGLLIGWILAIAAFSLWLQSRPVTMWPDYYPAIEERAK